MKTKKTIKEEAKNKSTIRITLPNTTKINTKNFKIWKEEVGDREEEDTPVLEQKQKQNKKL